MGEARVAALQRAIGPARWEAARHRHLGEIGHLVSDAEIATRVTAENHARADEGAARWLANAAAAHASTVIELKATMTAEQWEAQRADTMESFRWSREAAARDWIERSAPLLPPALRSLPDHLDPATVVTPEDWQVAMHLRPVKLDLEGNPVTTGRPGG